MLISTQKIGLIPGRFAPFHRGHELLFKKALSEMDKVICLIFETDDIKVPLTERANWIRLLYPKVIVIEGYDCPNGKLFPYEDGAQNEEIQNIYIVNKLKDFNVTHVYSSELYGFSVADALSAKHIMVDYNRTKIHISGTEIRANPIKYKDFMNPIVFEAFMKYL